MKSSISQIKIAERSKWLDKVEKIISWSNLKCLNQKKKKKRKLKKKWWGNEDKDIPWNSSRNFTQSCKRYRYVCKGGLLNYK